MHTLRTARWLVRVALVALMLAPLACGSSSKQAANPTAVADQRLAGSWRLQRFIPEVALDLPLQAVLASEVGNLTVTFGAGQYTASGPGVNLTARYTVTSAQGDTLVLVLYDPDNLPHHFTAQFMGNLLSFHSDDKPWTGDGALQRS